MTIQEILLLITLIVTSIISIFSIAFTFYQIKKSNKVKQAEFVSKLLDNIRYNERVLNAIYIIDYSASWYDKNFHGSGESEKNIDAFLSQIDYICYLCKENLLSKKDFLIFEYEVLRVCDNYQCKNYLWNLYHWAKFNKTKCSFNNIINFIKSKLNKDELIKFESNCSNISGYSKYLNF